MRKDIVERYYLDRDTDLEELASRIIREKSKKIVDFLKEFQNQLQSKEAGEYLTVEDILKIKGGELENMQRFFRGAVVPYYIRQHYDMWQEDLPSDIIEEATNEIKRSVGFMKYDCTGHITNEVNSMKSFQLAKELNEFLKSVEDVCFIDNSYIFPDSKHFKSLEKIKGRDSAQRQVFFELKERIRNMYAKREIPNESK